MAKPFNFALAFAFWSWNFLFTFKAVKPVTCEVKKATLDCEASRSSIGSLFSAEDVSLLGYVNKSSWTSTLIQCNMLCLSEPDWCVSTNFDSKIDKKKGKSLCELNHHGIKTEEEFWGNKFERKVGFVFNQIRDLKISCSCQNGGSCIKDTTSFEVKCRCSKDFYGANCELSTCDISFATYSTSNVILYPWTVTAYALTFCTWTQITDQSRNQYPASLTAPNSRGLGVIYQTDGTILLRIDLKSVTLNMGIRRDGKWQHLCIAWRNTDGKVSSYRNGQHVASKLSFNTGGSLIESGNLNICRRSDLGAAFVGKISNFNIWSSFLSSNSIASMASSCRLLTSEGDIVNWSGVKYTTFDGQVSKDCPGTCYV